MFASLAVLAPAAHKTLDMKNTAKGIIQWAIQLLLMFACILVAMQRFYGRIFEADFPIQALAGQISPILGGLYAVLLLAAMFRGSLACMYGAVVQMFGEQKQETVKVLGLWAIAFLCSMIDFKELISVIFPACGYAYLIAMPFAVRRFLKVRQSVK